jgi:glucose/arabinose dehydrogenase
VNTYAAGVDNARFMHMNEQGYLLITQPRSGTVLALHPDTDGDGVSDGRHVVIDGLNRPHGVDVHEGWLYIGESDAIGRVRLTAQAELAGDYERLLSGLGDEGHWTKTVRIGPDGWLYFNSGSSCNVCLEEDSMRATMQRMQTDGKQLETVAGGLRNTVGFDWAPWDQALYGTDNGRDLLGDDYPPCELNLIENGAFYGWPYRNAANDGDPDFGEQMPQNLQPLAPVYEFAAHNAPLGMRFLRHQAGAERSALVALHGSWNRSEADGYKVLRLRWDERGDISGQDFLAGFIQADGILGRPVDIVESRQGEVFVSDDYTGVVYRVSRSAESADATAESQAQATDFEIDATLAAQGAQLYAQHNCVQCHADGEGLRPLRGLSAQSPAQLRASLLTPVPPMPRLPLSEQEQTALVHYLRQQFP